MKILYAHLYNAHVGLGGADRCVLELASTMKNRFQEEVSGVLNAGPLATEFERRAIPMIKVPSSKVKIMRTLSILSKTITKFRPDLIHSHHRYMTFLLALFFKKKIPILHTEHVIHRNKQWWFRHGGFVTAVSEGVRQNLIDRYHVPKERVFTIANAVDLRDPDPFVIRDLQAKYSRQEGDIFCITVGRFEEQKGHIYLIEAISLLPLHYQKRIKVFLAGDGKLQSFLEREITRRRLREAFIFLGYTPYISEFLLLSDFVILPSLWEGMPLSVIEAFKMGRPVIATDIAGTREVVRHEQNGLLVPVRDSRKLAEAIQYLMTQPEAVRRLGQNAAQCAEVFSFDEMADRYHALYQKMGSMRK